jgi:3-deoxy-D-manno-octulosonic-acid transferase
MPLRAYRLMSAAARPLTPWLLARRLKRGKEDQTRLTERYGDGRVARPSGPMVWIHGASVGELLSVIPLIERLRAQDFAVLCTSGTVTSANLAAQRLPAGVIHHFVPLDVPRYAARFCDHWRPDIALFVESDLWPNLIMSVSDRGTPLILVNGRLSERSFKRWRVLPGTIAALLRRFDLCLAQSAGDAARLRDLGAPHVAVTGNLKLDVPEPPVDVNKLALLKHAIAGRTTVAGASTHPGEEGILVEVHRRLRGTFPGLLSVIAPRHAGRGPDIAEIARAAGLKAALRSRGELPQADIDIYVFDTMGELGLLYRVAPIVFVGGSLASHGGQNPIEPAKLGAAVLHGPNVWNFGDIYAAFDKAGAAELVTDVGKLAVRMGALLTDAEARSKLTAAAREVVNVLGGALDRTLQAIGPYLMQIRLERRHVDE